MFGKYFYTVIICFFYDLQIFLMDGKMTYVFYGFEYVLFMILKALFDFNRFW